MPLNLGEIDQIKIMKDSIFHLANTYKKIQNSYPNETMENLLEYWLTLNNAEKQLKKKFKDLK